MSEGMTSRNPGADSSGRVHKSAMCQTDSKVRARVGVVTGQGKAGRDSFNMKSPEINERGKW